MDNHYGRKVGHQSEAKGSFHKTKSGNKKDDALLLDSIKNNSNIPHKKFKKSKERCPRARFYCDFVVHDEEKERFVQAIIGCKQWSCPVCGPKNGQILRRKTKNGVNAIVKTIPKGFRAKYFYKLLTLTMPGKAFRARFTFEEAEIIMKKNFNKLRTAIKKKYGNFEYVWACEPQRDGYPHMHVLMLGENIAPRGLLFDIKQLWQWRYHMGFVKLNKVENIDKAVWYITKYMTKGLETIKNGYRVYSMSKKLRQMAKIKKPEITIMEYGFLNYDADGKEIREPLYINGGEISGFEEDDKLYQIAEELGDWFLEQAYKQGKLPGF